MSRNQKIGMFLTAALLPLLLILMLNASVIVAAFAAMGGALTGQGAVNGALGAQTLMADNCGIPSGADPSTPGGQAGTTYASLNAAQRRNAETIIGVGKQDGVPEQGWVIALMTAMQEATLLNKASRAYPESLNYPHDAVAPGDHDSVGLFQQRAGWGPMAVRMDPAQSAHMFYTGGRGGQRGLLDIPGWQLMSPGNAAQEVQVSAFPDRYAQWERLARDIVANLGGSTSPVPIGGLLCGNGLAMNCAPTTYAAENGLTPDALRVLRCIHQFFPAVTVFHGVGQRAGPSDHPSGRAVDAMIPGWENVIGNLLGWAVANFVKFNAGGLGVTYVIFDKKIWSVARNNEGWRDYSNPNGGNDPNSTHENHVHVSVHGNAAGGGVGGWVVPLRGGYTKTAAFGHCTGVHAGNCHSGLDLAAPTGTPILAAAAGSVIFAGESGGYGNLVQIRHPDGTVTYYAHQSQFLVSNRQQVAAGQDIGRVGSTGRSTGPHLHFEVRPGGGAPVDPEPFMAQRGVNL